MRIVIFGATGGLGRLLVERALAEGHVVTAFARSLRGLEVDGARLHGLAGNVLDPSSVRAAIAGQHAVICAFGAAPRKNPGRLYSDGTSRIVEAMHAHDVRRLICVSTWLVRESRRRAGPLVRFFVPLSQPQLYRDRERQEQVCVRVARLDTRAPGAAHEWAGDRQLPCRPGLEAFGARGCLASGCRRLRNQGAGGWNTHCAVCDDQGLRERRACAPSAMAAALRCSVAMNVLGSRIGMPA